MFREVKADTLNEKELNYLNNNLVILSAHYGALKPFDMIKPYRLDFNTRLPDVDLKSFWKDKINDYLGDDINYKSGIQ